MLATNVWEWNCSNSMGTTHPANDAFLRIAALEAPLTPSRDRSPRRQDCNKVDFIFIFHIGEIIREIHQTVLEGRFSNKS